MLPRTLLAAVAALLVGGPVVSAEPAVEFNRDVRPILSDTCFKCHGPDARQRKAKLRLDTADGIAKAKDLVARITSTDPDEVMPPPKAEKKLTAQQIETLKKWTAQGAKYEGHWSFAPVRRPTAPAGASHPIDAFLLAELPKQGLKPAAEADRVTLIRRLSFDLIGLPPTPEEVEAFVKDTSPDAYEKLVTHLLASPHYGERMAMFWLDLVRYADSVGYHGDQPVGVTPFRDWVIRAFNDNMRFDRFTTEQLAGDLLPHPTTDQKVAAGYNRLGMMSAEGGGQAKEYLAKYASERVRNLSGAWLGVTIGCAECHDHKFDPFSAKDFYRLEAFFTDFQEQGIYGGEKFGPMMPVPDAVAATKLERLDARLAELKKTLATSTPTLEQAQAAWEKTLPPPTEWTVLKPSGVKSAQGAKLAVQADGSVLASGKNPATDTYTLTAKSPGKKITAIRVEALPHDSLPAKGPGRAGNGNFVLSELVVTVTKPGEKPEKVTLKNATATFEQTVAIEGNPYKKWAAAAAIDWDAKGKKWGWAVLPEVGKPQHAVFETSVDVPADAILTVELHQNLDNPNHTLGHFRLAVSTSKPPVVADGAGTATEVRAVLAVAAEKRTAAQKETLAAHYRALAPALAAVREELTKVEAEHDSLLKTAPVMLVTVPTSPRPIRVLPRGNWMDDSGPVVQPGFPEFLPKPAETAARLTRLDLAKWVVAPENPLTARALANRLFKVYFGAGLSRKLDDLGAQGEWPTHPLLLDFLAAKLVDSGWDVKAFVRLLVTSAAYKQSSVVTKEVTEKDPFNKWLARQARFRLDAELVRDNALAVSGLLVPSVGGSSVKPYQPPGYWAYLNFPTREWQNDAGDKLYRRGLYTHWQRQYLHPSLAAFDAPSREECTADRVRSNTPLQALVLLNDPTYVEAARVFAEQAVKAAKDDSGRLDWMFHRAASRAPRSAERDVLLALLAKHRADYKADLPAAQALLKTGAKPAAKDVDPAELAAWTSVARAVLNLHAVVTRN
ncbi:PSD1 and planctomycete cytochrome C domain-containing protein [Fimbriiglobus ruber]|uniref:Cytochrome c domain-containing protein n=1 Tax=Fimbriiglobus ruber TaxID=1908690 RepID=A0A225DBF8_9BACT|nr:PSD1 and planctomycete cytochrome C domain-containing protein [Fimbriiglobus ruber]OWK35858.1 hypothetical protein FRUB_08421 [Fimbriiglobus ruber]